MNDLMIEINVHDPSNSEFRRNVSVSLMVADEASTPRIANQILDAVKATLIALSYSEQNVAELFEGIYFDEA